MSHSLDPQFQQSRTYQPPVQQAHAPQGSRSGWSGSRRRVLQAGLLGAGATLAAQLPAGATAPPTGGAAVASGTAAIPAAAAATSAERVKWFREARFGMFIHYGLFSLIGQQEWVMQTKGIDIANYEKLVPQFKPRVDAADRWCAAAKDAGQRYVVLTTKHHEGFCLWNTDTTDYNCFANGPRRDLVAEYVDACRRHGLRVGLYFSVVDWHHPDGAATDAAGKARFKDYVFAQVRELLTRYGKIDILWFDGGSGAVPGSELAALCYQLQPEIVLNDRGGQSGDFSTSEGTTNPSGNAGRAWESCMTMNTGWGYDNTDDEWKSLETIVKQMVSCADNDGNYLLNIGPDPRGNVPPVSAERLAAIGGWLRRNGEAYFGTTGGRFTWTNHSVFTRRDNRAYVIMFSWTGATQASRWLPEFQPANVYNLGGQHPKLLRASYLHNGKPVSFRQDAMGIRLQKLPTESPDPVATVFALDFETTPSLLHEGLGSSRRRYSVNMINPG